MPPCPETSRGRLKDKGRRKDQGQTGWMMHYTNTLPCCCWMKDCLMIEWWVSWKWSMSLSIRLEWGWSELNELHRVKEVLAVQVKLRVLVPWRQVSAALTTWQRGMYCVEETSWSRRSWGVVRSRSLATAGELSEVCAKKKKKKKSAVESGFS